MLEFNYICIEFKSILKNELSNKRTHQNRFIVFLLFACLSTIFFSFSISQNKNYRTNGIVYNVNNNISSYCSFYIYDFIEHNKHERESNNSHSKMPKFIPHHLFKIYLLKHV
jgi:predicted membrane channel-forming protein YqfA (hemolysin III family)